MPIHIQMHIHVYMYTNTDTDAYTCLSLSLVIYIYILYIYIFECMYISIYMSNMKAIWDDLHAIWDKPISTCSEQPHNDPQIPFSVRSGIRLHSVFWGRPGASREPPGSLPGAAQEPSKRQFLSVLAYLSGSFWSVVGGCFLLLLLLLCCRATLLLRWSRRFFAAPAALWMGWWGVARRA